MPSHGLTSNKPRGLGQFGAVQPSNPRDSLYPHAMLFAIFPGNESVAVIYPAFDNGADCFAPLALMENPRGR